MAQIAVDVVIAGASFGGVAAALAAAADPKVQVALIEPTDWIGGQATAQGVSRWDESSIPLMETTGSTRLYRGVRAAIRAWYRSNATLSAHGKAQTYFNPGFATPDSPISIDPATTHAVLRSLVAASSRIRLVTARITAVARDGSLVTGVTTDSGDHYTAHVYLDATDLGDLLPLAGLPFAIGAESRDDTGEPSAPAQAHPEWIQPVTVPIALELRPAGEDHVLPKPANYDAIVRAQRFRILDGDINGVLEPRPGGAESIFGYRRFVDARNFADAGYATDRTTLNVGSNDYMPATLPTGSDAGDRAVYEGARDASVAFAYWLQTEVERDDGTGTGYPNLKVRTDAFGTADGCAPQAYIRESRRIVGEERVIQQDIAAASFPAGTVRAKNFESSCGIGTYGIDIHAAAGPGTPWIAFATLPFQIPLGALVASDLENFVAACKNVGTTHLTSGAYRVHPVEWAIGEAAGVLAAFCVTQNVTPREVWSHDDRRTTYQYRLLSRGIPIFWWSDVRFEDDPQVYAAVHLCGVKGIFSGVDALEFGPAEPMTTAMQAAVDDTLGRRLPWPAARQTRAAAAVFIAHQMQWPIGV